MPIILILNGLKIYVYADDHLPPHLHAIFAEYEAIIDIETGNVLGGKLPKRVLRKALVLINENKEMIETEFYRINPKYKRI
jgi:hypothetical protein